MSSLPAIDLLNEAQDLSGEGLEQASPTVRHVAESMARAAIPYSIRHLPGPAPSVEALAAYLGCDLNFIVQSMLMRGKGTKKNVLVLHSAATRVNDRLLAQMVGENLQRADAEFSLRFTGYPGQCIPPLGLLNRVPVLMDINLTRFARVWCPSGAADALFSVPTLVLARAISARIVQLH